MSLPTDLSSLRQRVRTVLDALGVAQPSTTEPLAEWAVTVARWNERVDLTAARSGDELIDLLIADAAIVAPHVTGSLIDVGTGAGAPGLGIAVMRPDVSVTLVEPLAKRVALLRTVVGALRLANVQVLRKRGEELDRTRTYDAAISRATIAPADWLAMGRGLSPAGSVYVLLAQGDPPDMPNETIADDWSYTLPLTNAKRRTLRYVRR